MESIARDKDRRQR